MRKETKRERFQRIAGKRKRNVLKCLHTLGHCADPASYAYDAEELTRIFQDIVKKLAEVWHRLNCHSPYPFAQFRLEPKAELVIGGLRCRREDLAPMSEVLELLREDDEAFTALESIRDRYKKQFGDELCWSYPFCDNGHLGYVFLAVREGVLSLPYYGVDDVTYEHFNLESAKLLTREKALDLMGSLLVQTAELCGVLSDMSQSLPAAGQEHSPSDEKEAQRNETL